MGIRRPQIIVDEDRVHMVRRKMIENRLVFLAAVIRDQDRPARRTPSDIHIVGATRPGDIAFVVSDGVRRDIDGA